MISHIKQVNINKLIVRKSCDFFYSLFCIEDVKEQDIYVGLNQGKKVYEGDRMKKEDFVKLGVDEGVASELEEKSQEELKSYVSYERFKEVIDEKILRLI